MQRNWIITLLVVLGLVVVGAVAFSMRAKPGQQPTNTASTNNEPTNTAQNTMPENTQPATNQPAADNGECKRNFDEKKMSETVDPKGKVVSLEVKGFGTIKLSFDDKDAPQSTENFLKLVNSGFYNCLTFHRVAKGFVIQGGDPSGDGSGGPGYTVPAEIKLPHKRGSLAMARQGDNVNPKRDSSGSQFYIALQDLPQLDGQYTVFGQVISGMDVVDKIGQVDINPGPFGATDGSPKDKVVITKATISQQ
jgi:cyclophilin family peptidyl-prolyl cis-trans isomerase